MGDGARSEASWIVVARGGEYPRAVIRNEFAARNGGGEVAMRAVALSKGHALLDGRIEIGLGGGGTQTYLTQEALMLDSSAKIDAVPGLEIKTNDVKASHSATVSRVHPEDLFYVGVSRRRAGCGEAAVDRRVFREASGGYRRRIASRGDARTHYRRGVFPLGRRRRGRGAIDGVHDLLPLFPCAFDEIPWVDAAGRYPAHRQDGRKCRTDHVSGAYDRFSGYGWRCFPMPLGSMPSRVVFHVRITGGVARAERGEVNARVRWFFVRPKVIFTRYFPLVRHVFHAQRRFKGVG
jgi:hypothetical protein